MPIEYYPELAIKENGNKLQETEVCNTFGSPYLSIFTRQFQFLEFTIIGCSV